ncbi:MAG: tyrosine-type recombinase/integrase [Vicinamibacterales bacterium]
MAKRLLAAKLNLLSARRVFNAREAELSDGGGLLLRCFGAQAAWVFRYTSAAGKRREMGFGTCARHSPQAAGESLTLARSLAAKARAMLASTPPLDPIDERAKARAVAREAERRHKEEKRREKLTRARAARAYHEKFIEPRKTSKFAADWIRSLENHVPPALWHKPIAEITRAELLDFLRDIQHRMADTAQRVRRRLDEVFDEAIEPGVVTLNPVAMLRTKLRKENAPRRPVPRPALPFGAVPQFVAQLRPQPGIAARCLEFTITAARTGESIGAQWPEFDLEVALWTVPGERMKGGDPHSVHLSERAVAILQEMLALGTPYVFPSTRQAGPMSNMAMLALLERMKRADITVQGFRATFSTWANETAAARPDVIEACLARREGDRIRAAYNRAQFAGEGRKLLEARAAYLDGREPASNVIPLAGAKAA